MKSTQWLLAAVVVKTFFIGTANYLPTGDEAKQVLEETKHMWRCEKGDTPELALIGKGLVVNCMREIKWNS